MASSPINFLAAILVSSAAFVACGALARAADCIDNRDVQTLIATHQIKTWPSVKQMAGYGNYKDIGAAEVCRVGGVPHYFVNAQAPTGEPKRLVLNATDGSN